MTFRRLVLSVCFSVCLVVTSHGVAHVPKPQKIVSLSPAVTEILCAIGAQPEIVGITDACDYPDSVKSVAKTGPFLSPQIEVVVGMNPDLIITMGFEDSAYTERLKKTYLKTLWIPSPKSVEDIYQAIFRIGQTSRHTDAAVKLVNRLKRQVAYVTSANIRTKPSAMVVIWGSPVMVASKYTFISDMLELCGGKNVVDSFQPYPKLNAESILAYNPSVIFVTDPSFILQLKQLPGLSSVDAVKHNRFVVLDPNVVSRPGPRFVYGMLQIQRELKKLK